MRMDALCRFLIEMQEYVTVVECGGFSFECWTATRYAFPWGQLIARPGATPTRLHTWWGGGEWVAACHLWHSYCSITTR
jgi:hypothetical protein